MSEDDDGQVFNRTAGPLRYESDDSPVQPDRRPIDHAVVVRRTGRVVLVDAEDVFVYGKHGPQGVLLVERRQQGLRPIENCLEIGSICGYPLIRVRSPGQLFPQRQ